jgi:hypothetical protein
MDDIKNSIKVWLDDCLPHTKTEDDLVATFNIFQATSEVWIEASRQQVCVVCNHDEVLRNVDHRGGYALQTDEHESATSDTRAAGRGRLCAVCRDSELDAKRQDLGEVEGPTSHRECEV